MHYLNFLSLFVKFRPEPPFLVFRIYLYSYFFFVVTYVVFGIFFVVLFIVLLVGSRGSGNVADIQDFDDGIEGGDEDDDDDDDDASPAPDGVGALDTTTTTTTTEDGAAEGVVDAQAIEVGRVGGPPPSPVNLPALEVLALVGSPPVLEPHPEVKQEIADHHLAIVVLGSDDDGVNQNAGDGEPAGDDGAAPTEPMENFIAPAPQFIRPPVGGPIYVTSVVGPGGEVLAQYELDGRHCAPPRLAFSKCLFLRPPRNYI